MSTLRKGLGAAAVALGIAISGTASAQDVPARVTIATGPAGTAYNQIGITLSSLLQDELGVPGTARPFGGTSQYLPMLHRNEITMGLNSALDASEAFNGEGAYDQPLSNLRALIMVSRSPYAFYTRGDTGIATMDDLAGRAVITEYRAIASFNQVNAALLATGGLTPDDVQGETVAGIPDAMRALTEGRVDASASVLGIPLLREADASVAEGIRVVGLGENEEALNEVAGFTATTLEPGPAYVGITEPTRVARFDVFMNVGAELSEDHAYILAKTLHENWETAQENLPMLNAVPSGDMASLNFEHPYHPGAVRYFEEAGLWTDAHEEKQSQLIGG